MAVLFSDAVGAAYKTAVNYYCRRFERAYTAFAKIFEYECEIANKRRYLCTYYMRIVTKIVRKMNNAQYHAADRDRR